MVPPRPVTPTPRQKTTPTSADTRSGPMPITERKPNTVEPTSNSSPLAHATEPALRAHNYDLLTLFGVTP